MCWPASTDSLLCVDDPWGGRDDGHLGAYGCQGSALTVLAGPDHDVIDRSAPRWTVRVGQLGAGDVHFPAPQVRAGAGAWFAGNG